MNTSIKEYWDLMSDLNILYNDNIMNNELENKKKNLIDRIIKLLKIISINFNNYNTNLKTEEKWLYNYIQVLNTFRYDKNNIINKKIINYINYYTEYKQELYNLTKQIEECDKDIKELEYKLKFINNHEIVFLVQQNYIQKVIEKKEQLTVKLQVLEENKLEKIKYIDINTK